MGWFTRKPANAVEEIRVLRADARVEDEASMTHLLQSVPEGQEVQALLGGVFFARAWDKTTNRDYWMKSDGKTASCYTVCGLNLKQAAAVRVRWDAKAAENSLNERALAEVVSAETAQAVEVISVVKCEPAVPFDPPW